MAPGLEGSLDGLGRSIQNACDLIDELRERLRAAEQKLADCHACARGEPVYYGTFPRPEGRYHKLPPSGMEYSCNIPPQTAARVETLERAIRAHRDAKADDRCIEDDDRLYEALGDGIKCDRRVGDKDAMLANCARFIERRCEGGGWPTYAQLERALRELVSACVDDHDVCSICGEDPHAGGCIVVAAKAALEPRA